MMRISDSMIFGNADRLSQRARESVNTATEQAASGIRVQHAGDDPAAAGQMVTHQLNSTRLTAIAAGATAASAELKSSDSALSGVNNALIRATEIATQMANSTNNASDRTNAAAEVDQLVASVVGDLNAKVGNRYVLGGTADGAPPFNADGTYNGDANVRQVEIAPGVYQASSVNAAAAIKGVGGGVDVIASLQALSADLKNNDATAVGQTLTSLQTSTSQVASARASAGFDMNAFDSAISLLQSQAGTESNAVTTLGDVDEVTAASNLALAQRSLDAALTASAQGFQLSLLDKIR
jgi:flagellar hook-associated protein 3 FlgL